MIRSTTEAPAHASPPREVWFESDGTRLFAVDIGQGPPVVFLHGGLADHRAALFRVAPLAKTLRLVCPDVRGSGRSIHTGSLSWDRLADDIAALLRHLGLERAVVGGTSMGSAVALRFALRHPRLLRGLILMSPLYPGADRPMAEAALTAMRTMHEAGERALEHGVEALRPLFEGLPPPIRDAAIEMMLGFDAGSVAATTRFLARNEQPMGAVRELQSIEVPVLVLPGIDPQHPPEVAALYTEHLRYPRVVEQTAPDALEKVAQFCSHLDDSSRVP
jgi:pimeloyl-ACP methyl ester carboxylesterase